MFDENGICYEYAIKSESEQRPRRRRKRKKKLKLGRAILSVMLLGILFGTTSAASFYGINTVLKRRSITVENEVYNSPTETVDLTPVTYDEKTQTSSMTLDVTEIAEEAMPCMVSITNISVQEVMDYFGMFGRGPIQTRETESSGTGIIIGSNGDELLIVTNNHVVSGASTLSVCFVDEEVCAATIKGTNPNYDLAVIAVPLSSIKEETLGSIKSAKIGSSENLKVGEQVVAIGNALGVGQSVTTGIVSAVDRQLSGTEATMVQTDAAINPGNSGGALLNMQGEVIGINSAKFSSTEVEGMGYAIAISNAIPVIKQLIN